MKGVYDFYEQMLMDSIDLEGYDLDIQDVNYIGISDKLREVNKIFKNEYGWHIENIYKGNFINPELISCREWLRGLPTVLTVPFYNHDILNRAYLHDEISAKASEIEEDAFLGNYWNNIAKAFFSLRNRYKIY